MGKDKKIDEALKNAQELKNSHSTLDKHVTDKDNEIIKLRQEVEQLKKQKSDHGEEKHKHASKQSEDLQKKKIRARAETKAGTRKN